MTEKKEKKEGGYDFGNFQKDALTKPRDLAWDNWAGFKKVGDKVQGFIRDAFYRKAEGQFKEQRGITLEQEDGELINVGIKRIDFVLNKTDSLRLGDPLTVVLEKETPSTQKGFSPTKVFAFYGTNLPENKDNKTVLELDLEDMKAGGTVPPESEADKTVRELQESAETKPEDPTSDEPFPSKPKEE